MDMVAAIASGLPPIISDDNFWDVKQISELKDGYIGTAEGDAYLKDVAAGRRSPENPGLPMAGLFHSMVDVHYVVARAKYKAGGKYTSSPGVNTLTRLQSTTDAL